MSIWNQLNVPQSNKLEKILLKNIEIKEVEKTETKKKKKKLLLQLLSIV